MRLMPLRPKWMFLWMVVVLLSAVAGGCGNERASTTPPPSQKPAAISTATPPPSTATLTPTPTPVPTFPHLPRKVVVFVDNSSSAKDLGVWEDVKQITEQVIQVLQQLREMGEDIEIKVLYFKGSDEKKTFEVKSGGMEDVTEALTNIADVSGDKGLLTALEEAKDQGGLIIVSDGTAEDKLWMGSEYRVDPDRQKRVHELLDSLTWYAFLVKAKKDNQFYNYSRDAEQFWAQWGWAHWFESSDDVSAEAIVQTLAKMAGNEGQGERGTQQAVIVLPDKLQEVRDLWGQGVCFQKNEVRQVSGSLKDDIEGTCVLQSIEVRQVRYLYQFPEDLLPWIDGGTWNLPVSWGVGAPKVAFVEGMGGKQWPQVLSAQYRPWLVVQGEALKYLDESYMSSKGCQRVKEKDDKDDKVLVMCPLDLDEGNKVTQKGIEEVLRPLLHFENLNLGHPDEQKIGLQLCVLPRQVSGDEAIESISKKEGAVVCRPSAPVYFQFATVPRQAQLSLYWGDIGEGQAQLKVESDSDFVLLLKHLVDCGAGQDNGTERANNANNGIYCPQGQLREISFYMLYKGKYLDFSTEGEKSALNLDNEKCPWFGNVHTEGFCYQYAGKDILNMDNDNTFGTLVEDSKLSLPDQVLIRIIIGEDIGRDSKVENIEKVDEGESAWWLSCSSNGEVEDRKEFVCKPLSKDEKKKVQQCSCP